MAEELRYNCGMGQDDIFCDRICKGTCNKAKCKERIIEYFTKKPEEN